MSSNSFTIYHLPYGVITTPDQSVPCLATAYGAYAINLATLVKQGFFTESSESSILQNALSQQTWNTFAALPPLTRQILRTSLKTYLQSTYQSPPTPTTPPPSSDKHAPAWHPLQTTTLHYPMQTTNYSDFYCSHEHASNCSAIFNFPISKTWYQHPQVYNGRTSSLAVSSTPITRPCGIYPLPNSTSADQSPTFQPENKLDFELEMGIFISTPLPRGYRLPISQANHHIFGFALLNDWSARSIQFFEIQPLGPFHSKGALTSVAAWITPLEALNEHAQSPRHTPQTPPPLPHLTQPPSTSNTATWCVHVSASVIRKGTEYLFSTSNLNELHWTPTQMLTHLSSAGEGLSTGDIFGTGTLSSTRKNERGEKIGLSCIWERQLGDAKLGSLPEGIETGLLEDGDEVVLRGWVDGGDGDVLFEMGECRGVVLPAIVPGEGEM